MQYLQTEGIVLHSSLLSEADYCAIVLTKTHGKQKFVFKGLKKSKKRSHASSEPGSIINLSYFDNKKELIIAREFSLNTFYSDIRISLKHLFIMLYILELTEKTTGFNDTQSNPYILVYRALNTLSKTMQPYLLLLQYQMQLMKFQGILPRLDFCSACGKKIKGFTLESDFSITCAQCGSTGSIAFSESFHDIMLMSLNIRHEIIARSLHADEALLHGIFHLSLLIEQYHGISIKSYEMVFSANM